MPMRSEWRIEGIVMDHIKLDWSVFYLFYERGLVMEMEMGDWFGVFRDGLEWVFRLEGNMEYKRAF